MKYMPENIKPNLLKKQDESMMGGRKAMSNKA